MGWFDEQIKERKRHDAENFADAMDEISSIITRKRTNFFYSDNEKIRDKSTLEAITQIFNFYHLKAVEIPENIKTLQEQLEYVCRPYGMMRRTVNLEKGWYKEAVGAFLGKKKDGTVVALIPQKTGGYAYQDVTTGKTIRLNAVTQKELEEQAVSFYKPFPIQKLNIPILLKYMAESVPFSSYIAVLVMMFIVTVLGMISPRITHVIFDKVIPTGNMRLFGAVIVFSVCLSISVFMMNIIKTLINDKVNTQISISVQAATMARVLSLPAHFFKRYSAGELTTKIQYFNSLCATLYSGIIVTGLSSVFSLLYITQIFEYASALLVPALCIIAATLMFSVINTAIRFKVTRRSMEAVGIKNGFTFALISGIQKIKISGSEKRAFTRWTRLYTEEVRNTYGVPMIVLLSGTVSMSISLLGTLVMYYFAVRAGISAADYYAFTAAYAMVSGAFFSVVGIGLQIADIRPSLEQVRPIMETLPEIREDKKVITNISLKINPGQYVAVVGKTGCGKTTLLRLLLGFEKAQKGAVYYDGKDINKLDLKSLRSKIGVVMQNGKLFHGDIFSNIAISAPGLSLEEAWEAAEMAEIADDIRSMPMG